MLHNEKNDLFFKKVFDIAEIKVSKESKYYIY